MYDLSFLHFVIVYLFSDDICMVFILLGHTCSPPFLLFLTSIHLRQNIFFTIRYNIITLYTMGKQKSFFQISFCYEEKIQSLIRRFAKNYINTIKVYCDVNFFQISTIHNYNMVHMSLLHAIPCMSCMYHVIALIVTITMLCSVFQLAGPRGR